MVVRDVNIQEFDIDAKSVREQAYVRMTRLNLSVRHVVEVQYVHMASNVRIVSTVELACVHHAVYMSLVENYVHNAIQNLTQESDMTKIGLK